MIRIPRHSASLLISPPLAGKREFLFSYIKDSLKNNIPVIFLLTDTSPEDIKKKLVKEKIYYSRHKGILRFIDCYSMQVGEDAKDTEEIIRVSGPLALNEISIAIAQIESELYKKSKEHIIIFDSLSTLFMYSNPQMVGRFLQVQAAKIKKAKGSVIFTLEQGMHDEKDRITIEHLMDSIIYLKKEDKKIKAKAKGIGGFSVWKELDIA